MNAINLQVSQAISLPAPLAAIWGGFLFEGLFVTSDDVARCTHILECWNQGCIELVTAATTVLPELWQQASTRWEAAEADFPGVFEYEVVSVLGQWLGDFLLEHEGSLPSHDETARQITALLEQFFAQDSQAKSLPPERASSSRPSFVVNAIPVLSTAHVTQETMERLLAGPIENVFGTVATYPEGVFLSLATNDLPEDLSPDLMALCHWVRRHRYGWLRLDADGDVVPGLPVFEW